MEGEFRTTGIEVRFANDAVVEAEVTLPEGGAPHKFVEKVEWGGTGYLRESRGQDQFQAPGYC